MPPEWRGTPALSPLSVYGLSSFNYSLVGLLLASLLAWRPQRALYAGEYVEAALWIWQGLISYKCDAIDLAVESWSHPVDRVSATIFTVSQVVKYSLVTCGGIIFATAT